MNLLKRLAVIPAALLVLLTFNSCEEDFNTIGGEIIGGEFDALPLYNAGVVAYSKDIGSVQTNGLPANLLGVYKEPVYGLHTASVLSQVSLITNSPTFGTEPRLDSVILTIPYYSTRLEPDNEGNVVYKLDSVYGNSPFKLTVSRSNFFINEFDPDDDFVNRQKYFSDLGPVLEASLVGEPLYSNESFIPSPKEVVYFEEDPTVQGGGLDTVRVSPRLRIPLSTEFFKQNIIDKEGSSELSNNNNFRNFIRGLYFQAEPLNDDGSMMLLDFNDEAGESSIILYYTNLETREDSIVEVNNAYKLDLGGNTINTFNQDLPAAIEQEVEESNEITGAENLFLKGGAGSIAVIDLFENEEELEDLKANEWLINEANLTFYVNQEFVEGGEPERIYLYNIETNEPLIDYRIEAPEVSNPLNSLRNHSGRLVRDEDKNGISYKMKITEHVKRILNGEIEDTKLGLVVTQNINFVTNSALKTPIDSISRVPTASVITPRGTVLYGNLADDPEKRLKFNIYYTETND